MAYNRKQRRSQQHSSQFYGFGALNVTPVRLNGIDETWQNPNLDTKPFDTHQPTLTRRPSSAKYPNFKYSKAKKRKKKKCAAKQSLLYYHHNDMHTVHPLISPRKHTLARPSSAKNAEILRPKIPSHSASLHNINIHRHHQSNINNANTNEQNVKNDAESIQFELMKEHMFSLKQQITNSIHTNQEIITNQQMNIEESLLKSPRKKKKFSKKTAIFVPTPSSLLCVDNNDHYIKNSDSVQIKSSRSPIQNAPAFGSPKRPKHQSFQSRPIDSGSSRPVGYIDYIHGTKGNLLKPQSVNKTKIINQKQTMYKHKYRKKKKRFHGIPTNKHIYPKRPHTAKRIPLQSQLHKVNVGLSSTFASNTPRIVPLNKLMANPKFQIYKTLDKVIKTKKIPTKRQQRVRPWSSKPKKTSHHCKKTRSKKRRSSNKKSSKSKATKRQKRPKSAPAGHRRHDYHSMQSYMQNIEQNNAKNKNEELMMDEHDLWNPFSGITMFELQYLISFLKLHQSEYKLCDEILDVLDKCLHFYVRNDSYETAWNAWNIIQKFLLPDTSQMLCIDKKLCREVLSEYQTQSRDLKHNHIDEALFDDIIQEIGLNIAQNIKDRQAFTIAFEKYVIDVQQKDALQYHPPQANKPKRPQSATAIKSTKDLIHCGDVNGNELKKMERPQSAIPMNAKKVSSNKKFEHLMIDDNEAVNVMSVHSENESDNDDGDKEEMKYCLDGIIDEM